MVSEVGYRRLTDFVIAHSNIGAILTFGETHNLVSLPDSRGSLAEAKVPDLPIFADASNADICRVGVFAAGGGGGGGGRGGVAGTGLSAGREMVGVG